MPLQMGALGGAPRGDMDTPRPPRDALRTIQIHFFLGDSRTLSQSQPITARREFAKILIEKKK